MLKTKSLFIVALFGLIVAQSCKKEVFDVTTDNCDGVTYASGVESIFESKCISCHVSGGIGPGDFTDKNIIERDLDKIRLRIEAKTMPPASATQLTDTELNSVVDWIKCGGSFEGTPDKVQDTTPVVTPVDTTSNNNDTLRYDQDIKSIIINNCTGCHNSTDPDRADFNDSSEVKKIVLNGDLKSRVLDKKDMPQGGPLKEEFRNKIQKWLDQGAKFN